jgi:DNA-binding NarL/FixJ family response regulator
MRPAGALRACPTRGHAPLPEVLAAIRRAAAGRTTFEVRHLALAREAADRRLTTRDRDVIRAVIVGRSNDEIAADLGLARKTIEAYLTRLYERFDCASRSELVARSVGEGWLEDA